MKKFVILKISLILTSYGLYYFYGVGSCFPKVYTANKFAYFVNPYLLPALFKLEAEENIAYSPRCSFHANQNNRYALVFCPEDNIDIEKNFKLHPGLSDR